MKKVNKYTQYLILTAFVFFIIASIVEPSFLFGLMFLPIPLGITHYLGSLLDFLFNGTKSKYRYHLLASTLVLLVIGTTTDALFRTDGLLEDVATFIGFAGSAILAVYFWYLTFRNEHEVIEEQVHSVYDL